MLDRSIASMVLSFLLLAHVSGAEPAETRLVTEGSPYANESRQQRDARMTWWREAKFGMFIHWGVYSVLAGQYEDVRDAEWIMRAGKIPVDRYRGYARQFNAGHYDPAAWADLAARAGMRYVVITAKHHDGFALYPSEVTDWDAMDAAGAKRDLLAPLAKEVRKRNLKFGLYYSQAQDWYHPGGAKWHYQEGSGWDKAQQGSFDEYIKNIAVPQIREILTRYEPDVLWWDTPVDMTTARARPLVELLKLRPGIISNDRLGGGYMGDTKTPENYIPPVGYPGRDWETCMTMNDNWGYVRDDHDWKSFREIITQLVDIVSKGGNYLLNVGPDADGRIPQPSIDRLTQVGEWMKVNGESVYGTQASPFKCRIPWGRVTTKPDGPDTVLYLHVLDVPKDGRLLMTGLKNELLSANFLTDGSVATLERSPFGPCVMTPEGKCPQGSVGTTIKVRIKGHPEVEPMPVLADADGVYRLTPMDAKLTGEIPLGQQFGHDRIGAWENPTATVSWSVHASQAGSYRLVVRSVTPDSAGPVLGVRGIGDFQFEVPASKTWKRDYPPREPGTVTLKQGQRFKIELRPVVKDWKPVYVHQVELVPVEPAH
jgi:alpha-L-fucosidase